MTHRAQRSGAFASLFLLLALVATGCSLLFPAPPTPASPPGTVRPASPLTPAPASTAEPISGSPLDILRDYPRGPERDLYELTRRLRGREVPPRPGHLSLPTAIDDPVGTRREFWVTDLDAKRQFTVTAELRAAGSRAVMWVADGVNVSDRELQDALQEFEGDIYPRLMQEFAGRDLFAGVDGPAIAILNARIPAVAGYYSEADEYPAAVNPFSNEMTMFYMSVPAVRIGSRGYSAVLAHEFQHMIHAYASQREEVWVNEGLSELASHLTGFGPSSFVRSFVMEPQTQLNAWSAEPAGSAAHYGAAYLFLRFLYEQYASREPIASLVMNQEAGILGVDSYVRTADPDATFLDTFDAWLVANRLDRPDAGVGYTGLEMEMPIERRLERDEAYARETSQYAGTYFTLPGDARSVEFRGAAEVPLVPVGPASGEHLWWSNRSDTMHTTLRREFDLSGVDSATLTFKTWYQIEEDWDYGYVTASRDGGVTWEVLPGTRTSTDDPLGVSFGPGYTGNTPDQWVEETIDLDAYAGGSVIVQFEYVTDEAVNLTGWAIDDIAIPEIGYQHDAETDGGWIAEGFVRTDNRLPQYYSVQLYGESGTGVERRRVELDANREARIDLRELQDTVDRIEVVVSGTTPLTSQPARYELVVR